MSGGLYVSRGLRNVQEALRDVEFQLSRSAVVLGSFDVHRQSISATDSPVTVFVVARVPAGERVVTEIGFSVPADRSSDGSSSYWTVQPWYCGEDRVLHELGAAKTTDFMKLVAREPVLWENLSQELDSLGGVALKFTATGSPSDLDSVSAFTTLRLGG